MKSHIFAMPHFFDNTVSYLRTFFILDKLFFLGVNAQVDSQAPTARPMMKTVHPHLALIREHALMASITTPAFVLLG